jgi:GDP-4-dehydro-6-deoxy-D-mannose reductase
MTLQALNTIVVTGVNGFVGKHMVRELHSHDITVVGVGNNDTADDEVKDLLQAYYCADLTQEWPEVGQADAIIHLAGLAAVGRSFDDRELYLQANPKMLEIIAESYVGAESSPRIVVVSSGAVYDPNQTMPESEDSKLISVDNTSVAPYTISKILTEQLCVKYRESGLDCIIARPFNHTGPGQVGDFFVPQLVNGLLDAKESNEPLKMGRLSTKRDFTDVRDVAKAYRLLATAPKQSLKHSVYNVCSGASTSMQWIAETLKTITESGSVEVVEDASKFRPNDPADIYGDHSALTSDTGWQPTIAFETTLKDFVETFEASS